MHWATAMSVSYSTMVTIGFMTLIYGTLLYMFVSELVAWFLRWRSTRAAERMLDSVPDVPYLPLPDHQQASTGGEGGPSSSSTTTSCVICVEEYARGEGRFVMPRCGHAFHRECIAKWLRQGKNTCPICRAAAVVVVVGPPAGKEKVVAAAVSTAEDMV